MKMLLSVEKYQQQHPRESNENKKILVILLPAMNYIKRAHHQLTIPVFFQRSREFEIAEPHTNTKNSVSFRELIQQQEASLAYQPV